MQAFPGMQSASLWQGQAHLPTLGLQRWVKHCASVWQGNAKGLGVDNVLGGATGVATTAAGAAIGATGVGAMAAGGGAGGRSLLPPQPAPNSPASRHEIAFSFRMSSNFLPTVIDITTLQWGQWSPNRC